MATIPQIWIVEVEQWCCGEEAWGALDVDSLVAFDAAEAANRVAETRRLSWIETRAWWPGRSSKVVEDADFKLTVRQALGGAVRLQRYYRAPEGE